MHTSWLQNQESTDKKLNLTIKRKLMNGKLKSGTIITLFLSYKLLTINMFKGRSVGVFFKVKVLTINSLKFRLLKSKNAYTTLRWDIPDINCNMREALIA